MDFEYVVFRITDLQIVNRKGNEWVCFESFPLINQKYKFKRKENGSLLLILIHSPTLIVHEFNYKHIFFYTMIYKNRLYISCIACIYMYRLYKFA